MDLLGLNLNGDGDELYLEQKKHFLEHRTIIFNQEVDDNVIEDAVLYILRWNREDKDIPIEKREKIKIIINTTGGDMWAGQGLIDGILASETPVIGIGIGLVASAGFLAFLACHERITLKNTTLLMHDGNINISNSSRKVQQTLDFFVSEMEKRNKEFVLSRTNMTEEFYDDKYDQEFYFYPSTGKELGVVHKIIGEDCDINYIL